MADWEIIKKLIQIVKEEEISGLAIEENGVKYEVRREAGGVMPTPISSPNPHPYTPAIAETVDDGLLAITSPMVGTFYRAASPESPPFVEPGTEVEPGKVVCIIEAMKLFNEIEAEIRGKVVKLLVENGQPVEYGQKLMLIKKA
ncbi:acetyl-CoA carboxylase, biotin carboxyl carrier protein [Candidatus Saganbacteria bacterium CG08_land_8_20_14_0_20_45_16]|uniref:Biotin carboxyl carrier protein of acetyl-CoA carboxylase n=1 Tax=Candidatus Saganbacteria bacterium CG08_land_8_20_14_0_20_45_16 TaxID=2014293 RepID=A0A2H0XVF4_UNCSA|nr:MAG: acetyl-CoA carboxylase, biotin carboxyl carrier protein [Candidatus Saganbacteria bacterium CG08_land_8_20_14_0_20_45_16]